MITSACKNCEDNWEKKDICYVIGNVEKSGKIKSIWFVYGDCYCAMPEIYSRLKDRVSDAILDLGIDMSDTNEIAKVKNVDPLGITDLRVRGMWAIQHPAKVFEYITTKSVNPHIKSHYAKGEVLCL